MKCPNCGNDVFFNEVVDTEYDSNYYYDNGYGTCSKCHKTYGWIEVFTFDHCEDIEEIKENDHL